MKKMIKKYWGVGLIIVLLSSLFVAAAPVSAADPLNWEPKTDAPSGAVGTLAPGTDIVDFAVAPGGSVIYAAVTSIAGPTLVQSLNGGAVWTNIGPTAAVNRLPVAGVAGNTEFTDIENVSFVSVAPDDPNFVVVADASANATDGAVVALSTNGGASFTSLGQVGGATTVLTGVEISPLASGGARWVAAFGSTASAAVLYVRNLGGYGTWADAVTTFTTGGTQPTLQTNLNDFEFSPNFPSDFMAVAVTSNTTTLALHVLSFNSAGSWDGTVASNYPVAITTGTLTVDKVDIALDPSYTGDDEATRIAFVAASINAATTQAGNIWRCLDSAPAQAISAVRGYASIAYDGTNLAAGAYTTNKVYRSADPLAASPTLLASRSMKDIGIDQASFNDQIQVMFVGETLYGAKLGSASALSKSTDYGNIWNDFTLLDSGSNGALALTSLSFLCGAGTIDDILVTEAGDPWYLAAHDGTTVSIYRMAMFGVTRIMCISETAGNPDFILRGVAAEPNLVYAADKAGTTLYYSSDGGLSRWQTRLNVPNNITDYAVESATTIYVGSGVNVYKSINAGFTWGLGVNTKVSGNIARVLCIGEGKLIVASDGGSINYSTDGGTTWTATFSAISTGPVGSHIAATGLSSGDYIFAAPSTGNAIYRCEISPANFLGEFKSMNAPATVLTLTTEMTTGLVLRDGVLYAVSSNGTNSVLNSTLVPTIAGTHAQTMWRTTFYGDPATADFGLTPSALKSAKNADGSVKLMAVDRDANSVYYFDDSVALVGPTLNNPADKSLVQIVSELTGAAQAVNLTWNRLSKSTSYEVQLALDAAFTSIYPVYETPSDNDIYLDVTGSTDIMSAILTGFYPGTTYYWRIRSATPMTSQWSEVRSFTVQPTKATVPVASAPTPGATITNLKPAFTWSPVAGCTSYKFQVSEGTAFAAPIYDTEVSVAGAQLPLTVTLEDGKTYFWRVKALMPVEGDWSAISNFTIALPVETTETPQVTVTQVPPPQITITQPPPQTFTIPPAQEPDVINPAYIWVIIIIGAILVIAVIVLIVRTRRSV